MEIAQNVSVLKQTVSTQNTRTVSYVSQWEEENVKSKRHRQTKTKRNTNKECGAQFRRQYLLTMLGHCSQLLALVSVGFKMDQTSAPGLVRSVRKDS